MVMLRFVTSTPKLRANGCESPKVRPALKPGLKIVPLPLLVKRRLVAPIDTLPPVGMVSRRATFASVWVPPLDWKAEETGVWLLKWSRVALAMGSKIPYVP